MIRSFLFMGICICWTYAVGIHEDTYHALHHPSKDHQQQKEHGMHVTRMENKVAAAAAVVRRRAASSMATPSSSWQSHHHDSRRANQQHAPPAAIIQPFTPCQLRFAVLLFLDGWFFGVCAGIMSFIVAERLQNVACVTCIAPQSHSPHSKPRMHHHHAMKTIDADQGQCTSESDSDSDGEEQEHDVESGCMPAVAAVSTSEPTVHTMYNNCHHHPARVQQQQVHKEPEPDVLALFRKAQQAATMAAAAATAMPSDLGEHAAVVGSSSSSSSWRRERLGEMI